MLAKAICTRCYEKIGGCSKGGNSNVANRFSAATRELGRKPRTVYTRCLSQSFHSISECEIIVLTGQGTIELAVQAMKLVAYDFLYKPFPVRDLEKLVVKAHERGQLRRENQRLRLLLQRSQPRSEMVGRSEAMQEVFRLIERAGPSDKAIVLPNQCDPR